MKNSILFHIFLLCICCMACTSTTKEPVADVTLDELPSIFPDYADVTIPPHIAPLRFPGLLFFPGHLTSCFYGIQTGFPNDLCLLYRTPQDSSRLFAWIF